MQQFSISDQTMEVETDDLPSKFSPLKRQFVAVLPSIILAISTGTLYGYSTSLIPELLKDSSDVHVTRSEASWIASSVAMMMPLGSLVSGPIMDWYGRKRVHFILCIPIIMSWLIIYLAPHAYVLLFGRIIGGIGIGMHGPSFPVYIGEHCEPRYRGAFLATPCMAMAFGVWVIHLSGTLFTWRTSALIGSFIPGMAMILLCFVPETSSWYISQNRFEEAFHSYRWLRGNGAKNEFEEMCEKQRQSRLNTGICTKLCSAFQKSEFLKPFLIILTTFVMLQLAGPYIVAFYSVLILEKTLGTTIDEYLVMNVTDVLRFVMAIIAAFLFKSTCRRTLMLISGIGTALSTFSLAGFLMSSDWIDEYSWFPIAALICYIVFISVGILVMPWCLIGELLPLNYRGLGSGMLVCINFMLLFFTVRVFPVFLESLQMSGVFVVFGATCLLGTAILYFIQPETKDRTLVEIENHWRKL